MESEDSLISRLRKKRNKYFKNLVDSITISNKEKVRILDVGGEARFWQKIGFDISNFEITVVNLLYKNTTKKNNITTKYGNALDLSEIPADSADVIFSNSVIEHVGSWEDQITMSEQLLRFKCPIFLQTPNYWFPMEPHFLFPFFQFLPLKIRALLLYNFNMGGYEKVNNWEEAMYEVSMVRLLSKREMKKLLPGCKVESEKVAKLTSGFLVTHGWPNDSIKFRSSQK